MARNASGTHSLPTGNPVVTGTSVSSTVQNATMSDISTEITDSLSRSGKGGMTAPLRCADGAVSAPAHSYTSETNSGFYRAGASDVRLSIAGTDRYKQTATGATFTGTLTSTGAIAGASSGVAPAVYGVHSGTGDGVYGDANGTTGAAIYGNGGVKGVGKSGGPAVVGQGAANGNGGQFSGNGIGIGAVCTGGATGAGVDCTGGSTSGPGVIATAGGAGAPATGAIRLTPQAAPSAPVNGDMWIDSTAHTIHVRINGVTKTITIT